MGAEVLGRADKYRRRTSSRSAGGDRHAGNVAARRRHHPSREESHPELAPSDFHLFGPLKHHLSGEHFPDDDAVERAVCACFQQQPKEFYTAGFQGLVKRWDKCLNLYVDYVEK